MTLHELMHWLAQFQGWSGLGLGAFPLMTNSPGAFFKLYVHPLAREFLAAAVCVAVLAGFWFSTTVPCVMIRMSMFLSVASDR